MNTNNKWIRVLFQSIKKFKSLKTIRLFIFMYNRWRWDYIIGLPLPRPMPPLGAPPPCPWSALGFLIVSSTERMRQVASLAAVSALILTTEGSHTQPSKLSDISSVITFTPYHLPSEITQDMRDNFYRELKHIAWCLPLK